jgi:hypothetical protein
MFLKKFAHSVNFFPRLLKGALGSPPLPLGGGGGSFACERAQGGVGGSLAGRGLRLKNVFFTPALLLHKCFFLTRVCAFGKLAMK